MQRFFALHTERLTVFQLPSYSPDYNPIEKLWKKVKKEGTHLQYFPTFEALTDTVEHALLKFANTPEGDSVVVQPADRIGPGGLSAPGQKIFFLKAIESRSKLIPRPMCFRIVVAVLSSLHRSESQRFVNCRLMRCFQVSLPL